MIVACSGIASPMRKIPFTDLRKTLLPRMIAKAAMNEMSTAGTMTPTVTMTLLMKYCGKSFSMTRW